MGFWHTGYIDFHETTGFGSWRPSPPEYHCPTCKQAFGKREELWEHSFNAHPVARPVLMIGATEVTHAEVVVREPLDASEIEPRNHSEVLLDGRHVSDRELRTHLARLRNDTAHVELRGPGGVSVRFTFRFDVAEPADVDRVDAAFAQLVRKGALRPDSVEALIKWAAPVNSAAGYCHGVCSYLYGVMAREGTPGCGVPYKKYIEKFNEAVDILKAFDSPTARTITGLVQFHLNQFGDAVGSAVPRTRLAHAAGRLAGWLALADDRGGTRAAAPDATLSDRATEDILQLLAAPLSGLTRRADELEALLRSHAAPLDVPKLTVVLTEAYRERGDHARAVSHARSMRHVPGFEQWAEARIEERQER